MKVALTGAAGHLGAAILRELAKRNIPVRALYRDGNTNTCKGLPVEVVTGDMMHDEILTRLMPDCDAVIHCAALISINGDPHGLVYNTNVEGTRRVINAALESGIKRFIHFSSIHAYRQQPLLQILDEQHELVDENAFAYDRSKLAGQKIALAANSDQMQVIVLNPTSVIGPYDYKPSLMGKAIIDMYKGNLPFIFNGGFDFCDCRDVANATVNALTMGSPGQSYLLGGKWHSLKQLAAFLAAVSSKKIRPVALPNTAARLGLPVIKLIAFLRKSEPLYTNEALEALFAGNRFINSEKARAALNFTSRSFEETIHDTFHWFKNNGYLD